jgi:mannosyl-oligosaccharide glucosidase
MSESLAKISTFLGEGDDADVYKKHLDAIKANVIDLHWNKKEGIFCDATIDEFEEHRLVCHKGYVTLLPFMIGLMDEKKDADKVASILKVLSDPEELWSPHGIRSLSRSDELYGTDENYWRSPVWVNMNYMILTRLYAIARGESGNAKQAEKLYKELRKNLVDTVYESWKETGFAWEQYNPETGEGQRTQHFTGWTSLVVKILQMPGSVTKGGDVRDEL